MGLLIKQPLVKCTLCNDTGVHDHNIPATEDNPCERDVEVYCECPIGQKLLYDHEIYYFGYSPSLKAGLIEPLKTDQK